MAIRTNSIDDIVTTQVSTMTAGGTWVEETFYNVPMNNAGTRTASGASSSPPTFPRTLATGANTTEQPFWAGYWRSLYEYYTVLGMEYEITLVNVQTSGGNSAALVAVDFDSYSDTAGSTGNITPDNATLAEFLSFRHVQWHRVEGQLTERPNNNSITIRGTVKPGQTRRNISNDGDVKTWTACGTTIGSAIPNLKEIMNIRFFRDPLSSTQLMGSTPTIGSQPQINCQVKLKYLS